MESIQSLIVYLLIDGVPVPASNLMRRWNVRDSLEYSQSIEAGLHNIRVKFNGGRDWVDPIGEGDSANPEFYKPSSASENFSVAVQPKLFLLLKAVKSIRRNTNRARTLIDIDNPLDGQIIEIWLGGTFLTNVTTDATGQFNAIILYLPILA